MFSSVGSQPERDASALHARSMSYAAFSMRLASLGGSSYRLRRKNTGARRKPAEPNLVTPLPRTADGRPDLQAIWTNDTFTPLERPKGFADKVFFAEAEEAVWEVAG